MKKITLHPLFFALPILLFMSLGIISIANAVSTKSPKEIVQNCFKDLVEGKDWDELTFAKYFSKDYIQIVNSKTLNYAECQKHLKFLKDNFKNIKITIHEIITENNKVVTRHTSNAVNNDDSQAETNLIAIFEIKDDKIISCRELTHMVKGAKSDEDIGSRY